MKLTMVTENKVKNRSSWKTATGTRRAPFLKRFRKTN